VRSSSWCSAATPPSARPRANDTLREGDVVTFPHGPAGTKEIRNETDEVVRVVIVSTNAVPDVSEYPDVGKIGVRVDGDEWKLFRPADAVEYYDTD